MKISQLFGLGVAAIAIASCNYVDNPLTTIVGPSEACDTVTHTFPAAPTVKNVLLEEFSGHKCPNCPDGAAEVEALTNTHGSQIVAVTIHPDPAHTIVDNLVIESPAGTGKFETIWYIDEGGQIMASFSDPGYLPIGLVDRTYDNGFARFWWDFPDWDAEVTSQKAKPLDVTMSTSNVLLSDGTVCGRTAIEFLNNVNTAGDYRIVHYLTEDSLTDWQIDGSMDVPNYLHRHILRAVSGGNINGLVLDDGNSTVTAGTLDTVSYSFEDFPVVDNSKLSVVSFIYDSDTREVLQTVEAHVKN